MCFPHPHFFAANHAEGTGKGQVLRITTAAMWIIKTSVTSIAVDPVCKQVVIGDVVGSVQLLQWTEQEEFTPAELDEYNAEASAESLTYLYRMMTDVCW